MTKDQEPPERPGEILRREIFNPLGISEANFAKALSMRRDTLCWVFYRGDRISADLAVRLERLGFGTAEGWREKQRLYDVWKEVQYDARAMERLRQTVKVKGLPKSVRPKAESISSTVAEDHLFPTPSQN